MTLKSGVIAAENSAFNIKIDLFYIFIIFVQVNAAIVQCTANLKGCN